jgi:hypothetical protein
MRVVYGRIYAPYIAPESRDIYVVGSNPLRFSRAADLQTALGVELPTGVPLVLGPSLVASPHDEDNTTTTSSYTARR